jgi:uncharacterized surface protein with fasciclin (FAS1) repeats
MKFIIMNTQKSQHSFNQAFLIAVVSILIQIPTQVLACPTNSSAVNVSQVSATNKSNETGNIVEIAVSNPNLKTLVTAIQAADLAETLSGDNQFTVFAPTDEAFAKLPKETLEKLLKPENKATLQKILTYHVVSGAVESKSLKSGRVNTVEGSQVNIAVSTRGRIRVNKSRVVQADIKATNGIIHVIDRVLLPPGF